MAAVVELLAALTAHHVGSQAAALDHAMVSHLTTPA